jgi:hypothetical protein
MSSLVAGTEPPAPVLSGILHALQSMREEQKLFQQSVNVRLCAIEHRVTSHPNEAQRVARMGDAPSESASRSRSCSRRRTCPDLGLSWICPICEVNFFHRESFKGHIRLCQLLQHQSCRLMADNVKHQALLGRFYNGDWNASAAAFTREFYEQIRVCSSSLDPDRKSHDHIFGWLHAAVSDPDVPFPSYAAARGDSKRRRKASESQPGGIVSVAASSSGSMSNNSSPELLPILQWPLSKQ